MTGSPATPSYGQFQQPSRKEVQAATQVTYTLHQRFHYAYDAPVRDLDHRLVAVPRRQHGAQRRRLQSVTVSWWPRRSSSW